MVKNHNNSNRNSLILYGRHPVLAALGNPQRHINKVLTTRDNLDVVKNACKKSNLATDIINVVDKKEIDKLLPREAVHQGFVAFCKELEDYTLEDICIMAEDKKRCHVLILDQVTDPQNIGAIIRSCVAFDTLALILQDKNSPAETGAMAKASAGTIEHLPICRVTNLSRAVQQLKENGFWVIGMDGYAEKYIEQIDKSGKIAVIMGSEGKGMRRLVEESCDETVKLPISAKVESLNVSTAAAITLYELNRQ